MKKLKSEKPAAQKEIDRLAKDFDDFNDNVKSLTLDRMNEAPVKEVEQQTRLSSREIEAKGALYLKPLKKISSREPFNEKFRSEYEFKKQYVKFIAEHRESPGTMIEQWTKDWPGVPAEYWEIPVNVPVLGPRYLAEAIKKRKYHRMIMEDTVTEQNSRGKIYGSLAVDTTIQRLDALPVDDTKKSIFMSASGE